MPGTCMPRMPFFLPIGGTRWRSIALACMRAIILTMEKNCNQSVPQTMVRHLVQDAAGCNGSEKNQLQEWFQKHHLPIPTYGNRISPAGSLVQFTAIVDLYLPEHVQYEFTRPYPNNRAAHMAAASWLLRNVIPKLEARPRTLS